MKTGVTVAAIALLAGTMDAALVGAGATRADAVSLQGKVSSIVRYSERPGPVALRTTVTENELNAYFAFDGLERLPAGVVTPTVTILGTGRVSARAMVDLDAVRKQKSDRGLLDPLNYLSGRVAVTAVGVLKTSRGIGRFELEAASLAGVPIPKLILQELVSYYSRTPENPAGISIDDPFMLPARIQEIQVDPGRAVVVQ